MKIKRLLVSMFIIVGITCIIFSNVYAATYSETLTSNNGKESAYSLYYYQKESGKSSMNVTNPGYFRVQMKPNTAYRDVEVTLALVTPGFIWDDVWESKVLYSKSLGWPLAGDSGKVEMPITTSCSFSSSKKGKFRFKLDGINSNYYFADLSITIPNATRSNT